MGIVAALLFLISCAIGCAFVYFNIPTSKSGVRIAISDAEESGAAL